MPKEKYIRACSIWRALEIVGDVPTLLILESAFLRITRFDSFNKRTGILRTVLSNRLKKLMDADCMKKRLYKAKRYDYVLTKKGLELYSTALMMLRWEEKWGSRQGKIHVSLLHKKCGKTFTPMPACNVCHQEYSPRDVSWKEGPGTGHVLLKYQRRRRKPDSQMAKQNNTTLLDTISRIIGDRWSSLIIRSIFTGINTYDEMLDDTGMATNILSDRLKMLTHDGFLDKETYQTRPDRYRYRLTEKGIDIYPILMALLEWGERWYSFEAGPPLILTHNACGNAMKQSICCSECGEKIRPQDVDFIVTDTGLNVPELRETA